MPEIDFYYFKFCPRCIKKLKLMNELEKEYPNIIIKRTPSLTKFIKRDLYTLPALQIGETILYGKEITKERILKELNFRKMNEDIQDF
jgi:glutaredoxin